MVDQITAACKASHSGENLSGWIAQLDQDAAAWDAELRGHADGQEPMHPLDVYTNLEQHLDEDTVLVMDGGDYVQWGRSFLKARKPGRFQRLGPLSHLGAAVPYAMAAKLAYPESKVVAFSGDGAFGFYSMSTTQPSGTTSTSPLYWATTTRGASTKPSKWPTTTAPSEPTCGRYATTRL